MKTAFLRFLSVGLALMTRLALRGSLALVLFLPRLGFSQVIEDWVAPYANPSALTNQPVAMIADQNGNVYVTGFSCGGASVSYDCVTLKYSPDGRLLWTAKHANAANREGKPSAMAVDASNNLYVTGASYDPVSGFDYLTLKYDPNGNMSWARRYNGPGNGNDFAKAVAVDQAGNVYVTGQAYITTTTWPQGTTEDYAYATVKYDPDGNQIWVSRFAAGHTDANPNGSSNQDPQGILLDQAGNLYVAGISVFFGDPRSPGCGFAIVKYGLDGIEKGVWRYDNFGNGDGKGGKISMAGAPSGDVFVAGTIPALNPPSGFTILRFSSNGVVQWVKTYYGPNPYGVPGNRVQALAVDQSSQVYVTGSSPNTNGLLECATLKYGPNGNQMWTNRHNASTNGNEIPAALVIDRFGHLYVANSCLGPDNFKKYVTIKYSPAGHQLWEAHYLGNGKGDSEARAVVLDNDGGVAVTGTSAGNTPAQQLYVTIKYRQTMATISQLPGGNVKMTFIGTAGVTNHIQFTQNFQSWAELGTTVADPDGISHFEDTNVLAHSEGFYRAISP